MQNMLRYSKLNALKCPKENILQFPVLIYSPVLFKCVDYITWSIFLYCIEIEHSFTGEKAFVFYCTMFFHLYRSKERKLCVYPLIWVSLVNYISFYRLLKSKHYIFTKPNCIFEGMEDNMCEELMNNYSWWLW